MENEKQKTSETPEEKHKRVIDEVQAILEREGMKIIVGHQPMIVPKT